MPQELKPTEPGKPLVIRPNRFECTRNAYGKLCQAIEHLGGVECEDGFAFRTAQERAMAAELLGDRFGTRFFEVS